MHDLEVLRARLFPKLRLPAFFLGAVFARRDDAADSLAQLASCPKAQKGTILESGISEYALSQVDLRAKLAAPLARIVSTQVDERNRLAC